ncbi:MAG: hypothetical protein JRH20_19330, partial [Deltaproteobacteria bacterium]|nr:hypothetical protein [Deltaproteobacteria bacterium]
MVCIFFVACSDENTSTPDSGALDHSIVFDAQPGDVAVSVDAPTEPRAIQLPADEAPHADPVEWWYYTGQLTTEEGDLYGFQAVIFQMMFLPGKPLYVSNAALTDVSAQRYFEEADTTAGAQPAAEKGFDLTVNEMRLAGHDGKDRLEMEVEGIGVELDLQALKPPVIQYGTGYMTVGSSEPFYYYSYTRMSASGTLIRDGKRIPVTGGAWMDHQWGTIGKDYGWDWFSLYLDDDTELMLFIVKRTNQEGFLGG